MNTVTGARDLLTLCSVCLHALAHVRVWVYTPGDHQSVQLGNVTTTTTTTTTAMKLLILSLAPQSLNYIPNSQGMLGRAI